MIVAPTSPGVAWPEPADNDRSVKKFARQDPGLRDPGPAGRRRPRPALPAAEVRALQPGHVPEPPHHGQAGQHVEHGRHARRRPGDRRRRDGARPQRAGRVHALGGLQLRGRDPHQRARRQGGHVHLDPHRGIRVEARETKLGPEEITRDIPNVADDALRNLDERGIVYIGAEVQPGRHPGGQDHAQGRDRALRRGASAARHLR